MKYKNSINKPDRFIELITRVFKLILKYRKSFLISFAFGILIIISIIALHHNKITREKLLFEKLNRINIAYNSIQNFNNEMSYNDFKNQLLSIIDNSTSDKIIKIAKFTLAKLSYNAAMFDIAISIYSELLQKNDKDLVFKNIILNGLAYAYLSNKNFDKAIIYFKRILLTDNPIMKENALINTALIYETIDNLEKAKELYEKFLKNFPDSLYTQFVAEKIILCS